MIGTFGSRSPIRDKLDGELHLFDQARPLRPNGNPDPSRTVDFFKTLLTEIDDLIAKCECGEVP